MRCINFFGASHILYIVRFIISLGLVFKEVESFIKLI